MGEMILKLGVGGGVGEGDTSLRTYRLCNIISMYPILRPKMACLSRKIISSESPLINLVHSLLSLLFITTCKKSESDVNPLTRY